MATKRKKNTRNYGKAYAYQDGGKVDVMRDRGLRSLRAMLRHDEKDLTDVGGGGPGTISRIDQEAAMRAENRMERNNEFYRNRLQGRKE